jgi:hypothetical protein
MPSCPGRPKIRGGSACHPPARLRAAKDGRSCPKASIFHSKGLNPTGELFNRGSTALFTKTLINPNRSESRLMTPRELAIATSAIANAICDGHLPNRLNHAISTINMTAITPIGLIEANIIERDLDPAPRRAARRSLRARARPSGCADVRWNRPRPLCRGAGSRRENRRAPRFRVHAS